MKSRSELRLKQGAECLLRAEADIRRAIRQQPEADACAGPGLIEDAARILVAISSLRVSWCVGREWHRRLERRMYRDRAWRAFDLLQSLGFVYCNGLDDPCDEGLVEINRDVLGEY